MSSNVIVSAGTVTAATGASWQRHLTYDGTNWWMFYIDSTDAAKLKAKYSADLVTWSTPTNPTFTLPFNHASDGMCFGAVSKSISGTFVVWFGIITKNGTTQTPYKLRATLSGTTITWGSAAAFGTTTSTSTKMPDMLGLTLGSDNHLYIHSCHANTAVGNVEVHYSTDADTGSAGPSTFADAELATTSKIINAGIGADIGSGNVIAVYENGTGSSDPDSMTNLRTFKWTGSWGGSVSALGSNTGNLNPNNFGLIPVSTSDIHVVVRSGSNTYVHVRYNGTNWTTVPGVSITNQNSVAASGVFLSTDGTNVFLSVIDSDSDNTVRQCKWSASGNSWGSWYAVESSTQVRDKLIGHGTVVAGATALVWEQTNGGNFDIAAELTYPPESVTITEAFLMPSYGGGTTTIHLVRADGAPWTGSETISVSGVAGWDYSSKVLADNANFTVTLSCPSTGDLWGTLTIGDGTASATIQVGPVVTTKMLADWDASTGMTVSGGKISAWVDKFAGLSAAQSDTSLKPYQATDLASRTVCQSPLMNPDAGPPTTVSNGRYLTEAALSIDYGNCAVFAVFASTKQLTTQTIFNVGDLSAGSPLLYLAGGATTEVAKLSCINRAMTTTLPLGPRPVGVRINAGIPVLYDGLTNQTFGTVSTGAKTGCTILHENGEITRLLVFGTGVTAQEATNAMTYLSTKYSLATSYTKQVIMDGDSYGGHNCTGIQTWVNRMIPTLGPLGYRCNDLWHDSNVIASVNARNTIRRALYNGSLTRNVSIFNIGENAWLLDGAVTAAQVYADLITLVQGEVAAGFETWVACGIAGGSDAAKITTYRSLILGSGHGGSGPGIKSDAGATGVIDFGSTSLGAVDATYYSTTSGHPTDTGYALMASTTLTLLLAAPPVTGAGGIASSPGFSSAFGFGF